ncbi:hypothetical protein SAMN02910382_01678 [Butyrivibrio sp. TB]|jgi:hypothetical protein|nr:hypothetical protein SAMN02910382_01678 [Butyrivibrio sp. TB]
MEYIINFVMVQRREIYCLDTNRMIVYNYAQIKFHLKIYVYFHYYYQGGSCNEAG